MTDFAKLGISLDTANLEAGVRKLKEISPTAKTAEKASNSLSSSMRDASVIFAKSTELMIRGMLALAKANGTASKATIKNLTDVANQAKMLTKAANSQNMMTTAVEKTTRAIRKQNTALQDQIDRITGVSRAQSMITKKSSMFNDPDFVPFAPADGFGGPSRTRDLAPNRFNTANIAAQFQDIGVTAAMGMNPLTVALQQGTQLSAILNSMESPLAGLKQAFTSIINPVSLLSIGLTALAVVGIQTVDWAGVASGGLNILADGMDFLAMNIETVTIAFVGLTAAVTAFNIPAIIAGFSAFAGVMSTVATALGAAAAASLAFLATPLGLTLVAVAAAATGVGLALNGVFGEKTKQLVSSFLSFLQPVSDFFGGIAEKLRGFGAGVEKATEESKKLKDVFGDIKTELNDSIGLQQVEISSFSMATQQAQLLKMEYEQTNKLKKEGIVLTATQRSELADLNQKYVQNSEIIKDNKDAQELLSSTTKGFFNDLRDGLRNGESLWKSFGDAAVNALNRILDKFLDVAFNDIFNNIGGATSGGGGGGIIGSIASFLFSAKGNSFDKSGVTPFAKGGAFTNSIVSSPTMFTFANGGSFGVMGEAGPEAVMPLHRGADGSLGVKVSGGSNDNGNVVVNVINNSGAQARTEQRQGSNGMEIDVLIDDLVANKIGSQGTATENALKERNNRQLIRRR